MGATVASIVTCLLPIVAIILGYLVLGEHITLLTWPESSSSRPGGAHTDTCRVGIDDCGPDAAGIPAQCPGPSDR